MWGSDHIIYDPNSLHQRCFCTCDSQCEACSFQLALYCLHNDYQCRDELNPSGTKHFQVGAQGITTTTMK